MPIWDSQYEKMSRADLERLQLERLQAVVDRVYRNVPIYRKRFDEAGIRPGGIRTLADLAALPFTTKQDLRDGYPYDLFAVPLREVVRIHSSSSVALKPIMVGYTRNDLANWAEQVARVMSAAGVVEDDVVHIAFDYGLFAGGFGMHDGAERLGASVIPASSGNVERQLQIMQDFQSTALVCAPSYATYMIWLMEQLGISSASLSLRVGLFGGEPVSDRARSRIEEGLGIIATDNYGVTAVMGPGIAGECELRDGLHINEDHFLVEVIDPDTGESLADGEVGEVVITTLTKEALPLIRYRTGDLTSITREPCKCGRTTARMAPVRKRVDDMIIIRGVNVYPREIESLLYDIEEVEPRYQIVADRQDGLDYLTLNVELSQVMISDRMKKLVELEDTIRRRVHVTMGITPRVRLVEPKTLQHVGKDNRVLDNRDK